MTTNYNCEFCNGTGMDRAKTDEMKKRESSSTGYVRCWNCNGNGLDPLKFFRCGDHHEPPAALP